MKEFILFCSLYTVFIFSYPFFNHIQFPLAETESIKNEEVPLVADVSEESQASKINDFSTISLEVHPDLQVLLNLISPTSTTEIIGVCVISCGDNDHLFSYKDIKNVVKGIYGSSVTMGFRNNKEETEYFYDALDYLMEMGWEEELNFGKILSASAGGPTGESVVLYNTNDPNESTRVIKLSDKIRFRENPQVSIDIHNPVVFPDLYKVTLYIETFDLNYLEEEFGASD